MLTIGLLPTFYCISIIKKIHDIAYDVIILTRMSRPNKSSYLVFLLTNFSLLLRRIDEDSDELNSGYFYLTINQFTRFIRDKMSAKI